MSDRKQSVAREIAEASSPSISYFVMTGLATVLASYGLLANSTAVIIGAMLVAMLLNPITGLSYALATADVPLVRRSVVAEILGVAVIYLIALGIGLANKNLPITEEMISRSDPGLFELVIAVAGGTAVAYATGHSRLNAALVGVAIATSLVPPLAASAIMLVHGEFAMSLGALLLFTSNYAAILLAAMTVFWLSGFRPKGLSKGDPALVHILRAGQVLLFVGLAAHLAIRFERQVQAQTRMAAITEQLDAGLLAIPGARLIEVRVAPSVAPSAVIATVRTPRVVTPAEIARLEQALPAEKMKGLRLRVRSVPVIVANSSGYLFTDDLP